MFRNLLVAAVVFVTVGAFYGRPEAGEDPVELSLAHWGQLRQYEARFEIFSKISGNPVDLKPLEPPLLHYRDVFDRFRSGEADIAVFPTKIFWEERSRLIPLLTPIDTSRLSNYGRIHNMLRSGEPYSELSKVRGIRYGVPYRADVTTLLYNTDRVRGPVLSFLPLWTRQHSGRIMMFGSRTEYNVRPALYYLGYDVETVYDMQAQDVDWLAVLDRLKAVAANTYAVYHNPESLAASETDRFDFIYGPGISLAYLNRDREKWAAAIIPGGTEIRVDEFAVSAGLLDHPRKYEAAHFFIDYMLSDHMQVSVYREQHYAPVSTNAGEILRRKGIKDVRLSEDFFFKDMMMARPQDIRTKNFYRMLWRKAVEETGSNIKDWDDPGFRQSHEN